MPKPTDAPDIARLRLQDDEEDIFASPQNHTPNADHYSATKPARAENRHDAQEARDARLQAELERVRDDLLKLTMSDAISFDFGSATIKPTFKPTMYKLAEVLRKYDRNDITIVGHTDALGSDSYNQTLSERRAAAVRAELSALGVPSDRIRAIGRGEFEPRADNGSEAGRQLNRRVEIMVQSAA